ncbi:metallophosphoesterase family protein [Candidatus Sumerlaeota bacterium]|nr:metallophosphoesterase family protein [Candidatus Sumerlaeota bacterium]
MTTERPTERIGVFSDIHGNLQALEAVLEILEDQERVDRYYCCGDIVGYGGNPNECVELIRAKNCPVVVGNHDHAALGLADVSYFNDVARTAIKWTGEVLTPENREFLRSLPMTITEDEILIVHSSPMDPEAWNYILTLGDARLNFEHFEHQICFVGHSHQPFIIEYCVGKLNCVVQSSVPVADECRYLINVGSVGQPRDGNPDACYAIYDRGQRLIEIKRTAYDLPAAQEAIRAQSLPAQLAERLHCGW